MQKKIVGVAVFIISSLVFATTASAATLTVPGSYATIQAAVSAAHSGDTINVAAGTYDSFSIINQTNLTITGAGAGSTFIKPATLINTGVGHKYTANMQVSVFVNNSTAITIQGMSVEDNGKAPGAGGPDALVFWNASSGSINNAAVTGTYTINGDQTGQGIAVDAGAGQATGLTVTNTAISGFQKNGIDAVDGNSLTSNNGTITITVTGGSVTGAGSTSTIAQNGILLWNRGGGSVTGSINGTSISSLEYAPTLEATGILAYGGASVSTISNVSFNNIDLYINSASSGSPIEATTGNMFDGVPPASASGAHLATIENKLYGVMEDSTVDPIHILPNTLIVTTSNRGIQTAVNASATGGTVLVTPGTYAGDLMIPASNGLTLKGIGGPVINLGSGYGINLDNNVIVKNFTFDGFTVNATNAAQPAGTSYAFKAYKADGLTLTNDTFNGGAGNTGGGVDINTTSNVTLNNVTSHGFHKNGFADTPAYTSADSSVSGNNMTFNGITATNNGWTGISFYTVGNSGGSASINGVHFTGANTISGNGAGIFLEGDTDAHYGASVTPVNTITSDGTTLDLTHVAFSANTADDIINYQTAPVNAIGATFGGLSGDSMTQLQIATENNLIVDKLDHSNLGLVSYYTPDTTPPVVTITPVAGSLLHGTETFTITVTDNKPLDPSKNKNIWVYLYNSGGTQKSQGMGVDLSSGIGTFTVNTTKLDDGNAWLDVGQVQDAAGNKTAGDTYFKDYSIDNTAPTVTVTPVAGSTLSGTETFNITINDAHPAAPANNHVWVYLYNAAPPQTSKGASVDLSSGTGTFTVDTTALANGDAWLDVGQIYDAAGNVNGPTDNYFKDYNVNNVVAPTGPNTPEVITNPTSDITAFDATLHATNGNNDAGQVSFWVSTASPIDTTSPNIPAGVYSTPVLTNIAANAAFSDPLSLVTTAGITTGGVHTDMPAITPGTTYYYVAWSNIGGTWYPGAEQSFTTAPAAPTLLTPSTGTVLNTNDFMFTWNPVTSDTSPVTYQFQSSMDPTQAGGVLTNGLWTSGTLTDPSIHSTGAPDGTWNWQVRAKDSAGTWSAWSQIWNVVLNTKPVTTVAANPINTTTATLNGTDGQVNADDTSFWWGTTQISGTLTSGTDPGSTEFPSSNWTHDNGLGGVSANGAFHGSLTGLTPNTNYYFVAWVKINGIWYPGQVLTFVTVDGSLPSVTTNAANPFDTTSATLNGTNGPVTADEQSFWWGTTPIDFTLIAGNDPGSSEFPATGWSHDNGLPGTGVGVAFNEPLTGLTANTPYYFVAWSHVDGIWYPGSVLSFTTSASTPAAPQIIGEGLTIGSDGTSVTITWTTDHAATSRVVYGTVHQASVSTNSCSSTPGGTLYECYGYPSSTDETDTPADTTGVTSHSVTITGLTAGTTYYFRPVSQGSPEAVGSELNNAPTTPPAASAPTANPQSVIVGENRPLAITLTATGAGSIVYTTSTDPAHGTLSGTGANVTYTPTAGYIGSDSFTFKANNGSDSNTATISITVQGPPVLSVKSANPAKLAVNATYSDLGATITSPSSDTELSISAIVDGGATTTIPLAATSTLSVGTHTILYVATDGFGNEGSATRTVIVSGPPVITLTGDATINLTVGGTYTEQGATATDLADGTDPVTSSGTVDTSTVGTYTLTYKATDSVGNSAIPVTRTINVAAAPVVHTFIASGNGPIAGGGGIGDGSQVTALPFNGGAPTGQVLGASTSTIPDTSKLSCSTALLTKYMRFGKPNDPAQVKLLQTFLNSEMGAGIQISGFFGSQTVSAVKAFQIKYANVILAPWNIKDPTGYVYKTTEWQINELNCSNLKTPFPVL